MQKSTSSPCIQGKPSLLGFDIINAPEGLIQAGAPHPNRCYDTTSLQDTGAGWTGANVHMERILRFISRQISGITRESPGSLVTVGAWSELVQ